MAYEIIGQIYRIGQTEQIPTKSGNPFQKRTLTLCQQQYDRNTGEPLEPNYPSFEFTQRGCDLLNQFQPGQTVKVSFDLSGRKYISKKTNQEDFFTSLRAYRISLYTPPQQGQQGNYPPPPQNGYQQQNNGYQRPPQGQYHQQGGYPPPNGYQQGDDAPPF